MENLSELVAAGRKKLRQPRVGAAKDTSPGAISPTRPAFDDMFPPERIKAIKRKELRRFKEAQDKKWGNWRKAVAEDKDQAEQAKSG